MTNKQVSDGYGAESIKVLEGLEAVRKRPGMYIGDTYERGLHHLVNEIVDNSVDEALAGFCSEISVTILSDDRITIEEVNLVLERDKAQHYGIDVARLKETHATTIDYVVAALGG